MESSNKIARALLDAFHNNSMELNNAGSLIIGFQMKPSDNVVQAMLAIWKCGGSYFPINPFYTESRLKEILEEVKPQIIIVDDDFKNFTNFEGFFVLKFSELLSKEFDSSYLIDDLSLSLGKDFEAVTLYTSGTCGLAKGTQLQHSCCQQRIEWQWNKFPYLLDETHCIARNALFHVDHFAEIFAPLLAGKCVVIVDEEFRKNPQALFKIMKKYNIMRFTGLPFVIESIVTLLMEQKNSENCLSSVKLWFSTGELLTQKIAQKFFNYFTVNQKLVNLYGCTETTGECSSFTIESKEHLLQLGDEIPIGTPTFNTYIYVMNEKLLPTASEIGEIYISGDFVAQYYVSQAKKKNF